MDCVRFPVDAGSVLVLIGAHRSATDSQGSCYTEMDRAVGELWAHKLYKQRIQEEIEKAQSLFAIDVNWDVTS